MRTRRSLLAAVATGVLAAWTNQTASAAKKMGLSERALAPALLPEGDIPSLDGAIGWLNSNPLTPPELKGKVVLVEFWTYTCINWQRTLPYVSAWAEKNSAAKG